jgi:peptidyl-tRNA hydrolase
MSKGKIAAQVSHVAMELADEYNILGRAIILKVDHYTFLNIFRHIPRVKCILDAGLTEVPPDTLTCIGFKQTDYSHSWTKDLKLV